MPKVLLLEDDRDMSMLLRTLLEIEGYSVSLYEVTKPALVLAEQEKPDLILLDVHLGGQDGIHILQEIRQSPTLKNVRIIMTSGMNVTEECLHNGADAFIGKPYMPDSLLKLLKQALLTPVGQPMEKTATESTNPGTFAKFL